MATSSLTNPFIGKPYSSGIPGTSSTGLSKVDAVKVPSSAHVARLAAAISRLPSVPSTRGNARDLFLP
jgi:hypothetical protein